MQLYQNPTILLESSVSVKLLLWAQDYCPIPKWQTQNTVRVIRVIAKPTTWKQVLYWYPTHSLSQSKSSGENVQLKYNPSGENINYKLWFRCPFTLFLPVLLAYFFLCLFCFYTNMYESVFNMCTCIFICSFDVSFVGLC